LGVALLLTSGRTSSTIPHPQAASVDRIDNARGYVAGNVCIISQRANLLKKDATVDEVRSLLRYMEG
jgi:hypothetical protein